MPPDSSAPADDVCLCSSLRRAARAATRLYDDWMIPSGLKVTQFSLLRNIGRAGEINVTDLAEKLQLERTAMGRNLDLLESRGLIRTGSAESDQRTRLVRLTPSGKKARDAALPIWRRAQAEMRRRLGEGAFASLNAVVKEIDPPR